MTVKCVFSLLLVLRLHSLTFRVNYVTLLLSLSQLLTYGEAKSTRLLNI